jgi:hypothetical protein
MHSQAITCHFPPAERAPFNYRKLPPFSTEKTMIGYKPTIPAADQVPLLLPRHRGPASRRLRLLRLTADSPDILAIIKHEGGV